MAFGESEEDVTVHHDGGDDSCGSVGWGSDDAAEGGIFFVDSEGENADPAEGLLKVWAGISHCGDPPIKISVGSCSDEVGILFFCTADNVEAAGEDAIGVGAAIDAGFHGFPDFGESSFSIFSGSPSGFVFAADGGDVETG